MGHKALGTTQTDYRVTEHRIRGAVDKIVQFQFDRHGARIWKDAKALLDHEHARMRVGAVAVPFGTCTEPSNVSFALCGFWSGWLPLDEPAMKCHFWQGRTVRWADVSVLGGAR